MESLLKSKNNNLNEVDVDLNDFEIKDFSLDIFQDISEHLPYERTYKILTSEELLDLINEAKQNRWNALDLSMCGLTEIPPEIGLLKDLEILELGNNGPIDEYEKNIERNEFVTLPSEIGELTKLKSISLYGTKLKYLPKELCNLQNLISINLNGCDFKEFPEEICSLINLRGLAIDNSFTYIPDNIGNLENLLELFLPSALITTLPESIGNLKKLKVLYLGFTNITELPVSIAELKELESLDLHETPIFNSIPPEIFNQSPEQIIEYILRYQQDEAKVILNESKMIIVGQGGVGKTSLLNRIINNQYIEGRSTEGIDIAHWSFVSEGVEYKLNVWDFGGQEIYHSTHQFFLTKRSLYVFVWDARQEEEYGRIDYWLNTIQSFANDSPIIIVVNKCDDSRKNIRILDNNDLISRFPQVVGSFNVSCVDNTNINILRDEIIKQAKDLPLMRTVWFSSWVNVRLELEQLSRTCNCINYIDYTKICMKYQIQSAEALSLIKYLHDLGVVLHFHDDVLLRNIIILNPEWGTDAVYKILDAQANILSGRNGIVYYNDLSKIWNNKIIYPENTYPYILKLMENFQLSFTIDNDKTYLVAELLDNTEKNISLDFPRDSTLNFRYDYNFLPAGIMTRFIVKAHTFLIDQNGVKMCWRKGAYLHYEDAYSLIRLRDGITERYLDIKVSGKNSRNRRQLLAIIRSIFDQIHNSIAKIRFTEKILCNCSPECTYLHEFKFLSRLEENGINEERCKESLKMVEISMLLDGIKIKKERRYNELSGINISPVFNNSPVISSHANASNVNVITIEIRNLINELQGALNELRGELEDKGSTITSDLDKIDSSLNKLDTAQSKDEIIKSGALNKTRRLIEELGEPESPSGKLISGIKYGYGILQDIAKKYNGIAEWCGIPVIPSVFLNKNNK
ncbi:small GTP-binding protein domain [Schinkia azotoformans MEV2011]|uniref:non-specific serine/threonine protein kinase n=1 Tax=Schinkia azotoformans MEV2011 TaxID=1348973 RepID=A0A072NIG1_SCHAZ|nr:COR domain-containing protein [Schinkia azotoformans]KEF36653.1 small GTP-binding protein domain [Schinkia azotoformans MEV2011]MEC1727647.1 COR domain-containing protein [Schinkia azotoformans]MEC1742700.1 COR domain-containing protein [Schinkia azotoformans]MEC1767486.1 COR domain-containing protein [Schinkia azotoformans]MEC1773267.1 COR domain-containing protein [Schinkia azotoformans]